MSTSFTELMRTGQEQFLETVRQSQKAVVDAVGAWAKAVERTPSPAATSADSANVPRADEVVDNVFDFAEKLLAAQREFTRNLVKAAQPAVDKAQGSAHAAAKNARKAAS
jgi:hypothetical protein